MRFDRLHLLRYGALGDRELVFQPDARLHVVYGPNEAGKSSALAAISDLLFGFPHLKAFDFRHDAGALRIGATLRARDGSEIAFRRRRGNKATLLADDDDESPLKDDALAPFLGSLSREVFERAFGLDSQRLRHGADEMLRSDGELGGTLFAAASGLTGLSGLRKELEGEAAMIYAPRAKERVFNLILSRHEEARKAERDSELKASDWKALNLAIDDLQDRYGRMAEERATTRARLDGLRRLRQLEPILREIDGDENRLSAYGDLGALPVGFAERLAQALDAVATAGAAMREAAEQVDKCGQGLGRLAVDEALLAEAQAISALYAQSGDFVGKQRDLPRIEAERDDYAAEIRGLALRLGLGDTELDRRQPTDAALAHVRDLVERGQRLAERASALDRREREERQALERLKAEQPAQRIVDPRPWRDRLSALAPDLRAIERRDEIATAEQAEARRIAESAARLSPSVADLDRLAAAPLPTPETLTRQRDALARIDAERRTLLGRESEAEEEARRLDAAIADAERGGPVPSEAAIADAREARDTGFSGLADMLTGKEALAPPERAAGEVARVRRLTGEADALADAALADAARVHAHAAQLRQKTEIGRTRDRLRERAAALEAELDEAARAYRAPFETLGLEAGAPDDMIAWLRAVADLLEARRQALGRADEVAALDRRAAAIRPELEAIAVGVAIEGGATLPLAALARAVEARLEALADGWSDSRAHAARIEDYQRRLEEIGLERGDAAAQTAEWRELFRAETASLGLGDEATIAQADATLKLWQRLPDIARERDNRQRRVAGMRRDAEAFEDKATALAAALAPDLQGLPPAHIVKTLGERAQAAATADTQRRDARAALAEAEAELARRRQAEESATAGRDRLLAQAPEGADAAALVVRLRERDELSEELRRCRHRFVEVAGGTDETAIRAELAGFDRARAETDIETLEREEARLDGEMAELFAELSAKRRERERLDQASGAEQAAFARNAAETEIVEAARQWTVLRLASGLLSAAIESHRESQDDPLMRRAGELFSILTTGSFATLAQQYDEQDQAQLVGVRGSGERVGIAGLSDGTRDQLYLALRLAFLEDYAARNEPAPFIGDDIFQTFDDARTAAGLAALAEASGSFQPVLFAHHRSVVDIARDTLGGGVDIIEL